MSPQKLRSHPRIKIRGSMGENTFSRIDFFFKSNKQACPFIRDNNKQKLQKLKAVFIPHLFSKYKHFYYRDQIFVATFALILKQPHSLDADQYICCLSHILTVYFSNNLFHACLSKIHKLHGKQEVGRCPSLVM